MAYRDFQHFLDVLAQKGELKRISEPVSPTLEITEIADRVMKAGGPALLFENPVGPPHRLTTPDYMSAVMGHPSIHKPSSADLIRYAYPVVINTMGSKKRMSLALSCDDYEEHADRIASLLKPEIPKGIGEALKKLPWLLGELKGVPPKTVTSGISQQIVMQGDEVDLTKFPAPFVHELDGGRYIGTEDIVVMRDPDTGWINVGTYRIAVQSKNTVGIWISPGKHGRLIREKYFAKGQPCPVVISCGQDPILFLCANAEMAEGVSEYDYAGGQRGRPYDVIKSELYGLPFPASSELVLEGEMVPGETQLEGPFGDHTGYYNEQERFPVFTIERMTLRREPVYHSTYTGKPPDEPAMLGTALNEVFVPLLQKQFPEIVDFYLPPEGCSYRMAVVSMKKQYAGHAKRVMFGIWSYLRQFMYTKFIIVTDDDVNVRDWKEVIWAVTTRVDPQRDTLFADNTPIDYLDFASPVAGLGSKMGIDATNKWPQETARQWGTPIAMDDAVKQRIDALWQQLGL
jgi:4-hydroxy-3-polyprenylbenzoate decarboxylase